MHEIQDVSDLLSPAAVYQEKQFLQARTQLQAQSTPTKLKFERRKASQVTTVDKLDSGPEQAATAHRPEPESATVPAQASAEAPPTGQQAAASSSLRQKSVQDYKNSFKNFKQFLQKKREGEPVNQGRGSALNREERDSGTKAKGSTEKLKNAEQN